MVQTANNDTNKNAGPNGTTMPKTSFLAGDAKNRNGNNNKEVWLITSTMINSIRTTDSQFSLLLIKELVLPLSKLLK